ncbi:MAG TPA: CHRD domain-containing protein [Nitrososphaeraceae archaeon]|nr:CHRD domain-containing protein [Nitrososphaeraceae archaeon]
MSYNTSLSENNKYLTSLTGIVEVPPVNTNSTGITLFELINNFIDFRVNVSNLDDITAAHLHSGEFGQNGEILALVLNPQRQLMCTMELEWKVK